MISFKKFMVIKASAILLLIACSDSSAFELTGFWSVRETIHPSDKVEMIFSWGKSFLSRGPSLAIDDKDESPMIHISGFGSFPITEVEYCKDIIRLTFFFSRGGFDILCLIHPVDENRMWIEDIDGISMFPTGKKEIYYKHDGPSYHPFNNASPPNED